jgi:cell division protease FtsH
MGSGAQSDIQMVSKLVRRMVTKWGMSEKLGPIAFGERDEQIFLGREIAQHTDYSEKTAQAIDDEVNRIVSDSYGRAKEILEEKIDVLHAMAAALLDRETLNSEEVLLLLDGKELEPLGMGHEADLESGEEEATETERTSERKEFPGGIPPLADPDPST